MEKQSVVHRLRLKVKARRAVRRALPFVASLFLATPLAAPVSSTAARTQSMSATAPVKRVLASVMFAQGTRQLYNELKLSEQGLNFDVFEKAYTGYLNLRAQGKLNDERQLLTVVDFNLPSTEKRLWVLDLEQKTVVFNTLVAHGHNSGENMATNFSNQNESNMSSLGFYVTDTEYYGKHGRSLKLDGVDLGYNDNARDRAVVMHGAEYVSEDFIRQFGRLGRSLGCPALPMDQYAQIIDAVGGGTCLFLNGNSPDYQSQYLNTDLAASEFVSTDLGESV
ncbi:murein L,D-transpeptidase catalytic domain family protein [Hymenobacter latericus]|uniref:murein L,D-transpeptidase catalytic domain family protein n=1 Tax=Hymenobacter sp. YIM 151858-1 TaxID=2987688 RepID=UPI0022261EA5|nr:murein L,D-transpeptidase catalytic domain family protein [Hymenobacter sp. YIM 151858-1]UYZ58932.1 murein L,D-transpeptidase catalytic domain family protein [Hymenobacter sp. YIM 151858-1]